MIWRIRSLLFSFLFFAVTGVMMFICIPFLLAPPLWQRGVPAMWVWTVYWLERYILGLDYVVIGKENLPPPPYLIAMKHQSAWETMKLYAIFGFPAIIFKKELMNIPVWGQYTKVMEMVPIDRTKGREATNLMVQHARKILVDKRPLVIFPQGTRVAVGDKKPYKFGVIKLYKELNVPVVPVAHNAGVFWARKALWKHPGIVTVEILPPIPAGLEGDVVARKIEEQLETTSNRLALEAIHTYHLEEKFPDFVKNADV